jgi:hypothetical protein
MTYPNPSPTSRADMLDVDHLADPSAISRGRPCPFE